jgi:tagatose-1,6-bisphosphate aldolase
MSYARFGCNGSAFYVYWKAGDDNSCWRNQVVAVNCLHEFTAKHIDEDIESALDICTREPTTNPNNPGYGKSQSELKEELRGYLKSFLDDVKSDLPSQEGE